MKSLQNHTYISFTALKCPVFSYVSLSPWKILVGTELFTVSKVCLFLECHELGIICSLFFHLATCFFFFSFSLFRAAPAAYGGSQARGRIRATATGLHHSHMSHICDLQHSSRKHRVFNPLSEAGIEPASSQMLARSISAEPRQELQQCVFKSPPCLSVAWQLISFYYRIIFHCVYTTVCLSIQGRHDRFKVLPIMNKNVVNIHVQGFVWTQIFISFG